MHPSAHAHMKLCIDTYLHKDMKYRVIDLGSRISGQQTATHRELLRDHQAEIIGVDIQPGRNVDVVMKKPYSIPQSSRSADVVISGQAFEHIPFFWASFLEMARVLRPRGYIFLTAPSRGHVHDVYDCWRYYPDGLRALAAFAGLSVVEAHTDFPPVRAGRRHDYAKINASKYYWGDSVGVFRKPQGSPSPGLMLATKVITAWANRVGDLSGTPVPTPLPARQRVVG